jgi:hypothetical protein
LILQQNVSISAVDWVVLFHLARCLMTAWFVQKRCSVAPEENSCFLVLMKKQFSNFSTLCYCWLFLRDKNIKEKVEEADQKLRFL